MIRTLSPRNLSLLFTGSSFVLGLGSIQLGRRLNYLEHLSAFNALAAVMLGLVSAGLMIAVVSLIKARGKSGSLWVSAGLATVLLASYLFDD